VALLAVVDQDGADAGLEEAFLLRGDLAGGTGAAAEEEDRGEGEEDGRFWPAGDPSPGPSPTGRGELLCRAVAGFGRFWPVCGRG
jgi:hypothetical protein